MANGKLILQVDLLTDKLGFDAAFNYKEESDLKSTLKRLTSYPSPSKTNLNYISLTNRLRSGYCSHLEQILS